MIFEYDPQKSACNKAKHGIDFIEAQMLWGQPILEVPGDFRGEPRSLVIGKISGKYWTAIVTDRHSVIRIISVRRAKHNEIEGYERGCQRQK